MVRIIKKIFSRLKHKYNFSPLPFCVFFPNSAWHHKACCFRYFPQYTFVLSFSLQVFLTLIWPLRLLFQAIYCFKIFGKKAGVLSSRHSLRIFIESVFYGLWLAMPPRQYYRYQIFSHKHPAKNWLLDHQIFALLPYVNNYLDDERISDKARFYQFCQEHNFSYPKTFLATELADLLKQPAFIIKKKQGSGGEGFQVCTKANNTWHIAKHIKQNKTTIIELNNTELLHYLKSKDNQYLFQEQLVNHSGFNFVNAKQLITLRLISIKKVGEEVSCIAGLLFIPKPHHLNNNNGFIANVNIETGKVGLLFNRKPLQQGVEYYPKNHKRITNQIVPLFNEAKLLATSCHKHYSQKILAFDLAITQQQVSLLEINTGFDIASHQITHQKPTDLFSNLMNRF